MIFSGNPAKIFLEILARNSGINARISQAYWNSSRNCSRYFPRTFFLINGSVHSSRVFNWNDNRCLFRDFKRNSSSYFKNSSSDFNGYCTSATETHFRNYSWYLSRTLREVSTAITFGILSGTLIGFWSVNS